MIGAFASEVSAQSLRIVKAVGGELVERRVRVGQALLVSWESKCSLPNPHLRLRNDGEKGEDENSKGSRLEYGQHSALKVSPSRVVRW